MIGKGKSIAHTGASMAYGWNQDKEAEVVFSQHLAGNDPKQVTGGVQTGAGTESKVPEEHLELCPKSDPPKRARG